MGRGPGPNQGKIVLLPLQATGRTDEGEVDPTARPVGVATAGSLKREDGTERPIGNHTLRLGTGLDETSIPGAQMSADGKYVLMITNPLQTTDFRTTTAGVPVNSSAFLLLENDNLVITGMIKSKTGQQNITTEPSKVELMDFDNVLGFKFTSVDDYEVETTNAGRASVTTSVTNGTDYYVYVATDGTLTLSATLPFPAVNFAVPRAKKWAALSAQRERTTPVASDAYQVTNAYDRITKQNAVTFNGVPKNGSAEMYNTAGLDIGSYDSSDIGLVIDKDEVSYLTVPIDDNDSVGVLSTAAGSSVSFDASFKNADDSLEVSAIGVLTLIANVGANEDVPHSITGITLGNTATGDIVFSSFTITRAFGSKVEGTYQFSELIGTSGPWLMLEINNTESTLRILPTAMVKQITYTV